MNDKYLFNQVTITVMYFNKIIQRFYKIQSINSKKTSFKSNRNEPVRTNVTHYLPRKFVARGMNRQDPFVNQYINFKIKFNIMLIFIMKILFHLFYDIKCNIFF